MNDELPLCISGIFRISCIAGDCFRCGALVTSRSTLSSAGFSALFLISTMQCSCYCPVHSGCGSSVQSGTIWRHPNLGMAYVAQHAFHHVEQHLESSPSEYIRWRFARGEDREELNKVKASPPMLAGFVFYAGLYVSLFLCIFFCIFFGVFWVFLCKCGEGLRAHLGV